MVWVIDDFVVLWIEGGCVDDVVVFEFDLFYG